MIIYRVQCCAAAIIGVLQPCNQNNHLLWILGKKIIKKKACIADVMIFFGVFQGILIILINKINQVKK